MAPLNFCPVCRIHHDKVKGHKYGVKHKKYLTEFLSKARKKLQDVRLSMKEVTTLQDEDRDRSKFWCAFCEQEIDEKKSVFVSESTIQHLGNPQHVFMVKKFLADQGAHLADSFSYFISKEETLQWQERCKNLTATMAKTSVVELPGTNNIHSGTSLNDEGSSLALGSRQSFSHVASVHDVQPLTVLTVGRTQNSLSTHNEVSSAATETGSLRRHSVSDRTETLVDFANEWAGVSGNSVHYMDSAKFLVPTNFGLEASTRKPSDDYRPTEVFKAWRGTDTSHYTQGRGVNWSATNGAFSVQGIMQSLPGAAPVQYTVMASGQTLSKIVCPPLLSGEGNVHSGGTPPWIGPNEDKKLFDVLNDEIGPSIEAVKKQSLSKTQERKLAKLRPPNRVGAAWAEMRRAQLERAERGETLDVPQADASWLPNFGRVWQSGSRHDTRREFEAEKRREAKRLASELGKRTVTSVEGPVQFQPYVSKRRVA
uniref:Coiled-coil domain-containing protein 84 n=2 Tax=Physcomitrium patens TaxID=3218 RepID=A0A2K1KGN1_PHYPA|nr:TITAN-like protein isoform X2 [Physcomitrium patens]PNR52919.1 hypothetical protein PHYPA_009294 [Physcomitrium patens]|eukprot:XP_024379043.1 TITAN-like protein isoform X2 [Physcomitrella patens]